MQMWKRRDGESDACGTYCQAVVASLNILLLCAALVSDGIVVLGPPVIVRLLLRVRVRLSVEICEVCVCVCV